MKKQTSKPTPRPMPQPVPGAKPRWLLGAFLCLLVAAVTWSVLEFVVWNKLPPDLVGTWEVTDGPQEGATFEFHRSGKMIGHLNQGGNLSIVRAMVHIEDGKLYSTTWHPQTGEEKVTVQTIRTLSSRQLVLEDERGRRLTLRKVP
jgi:hypothetical protein